MKMESYIQRNATIDCIIAGNLHDGTCFNYEDDIVENQLHHDYIYEVFMIDRLGFPNSYGLYVYSGMDGDQLILKSADWNIDSKYNMLLIPSLLLDRILFRSCMDKEAH